MEIEKEGERYDLEKIEEKIVMYTEFIFFVVGPIIFLIFCILFKPWNWQIFH